MNLGVVISRYCWLIGILFYVAIVSDTKADISIQGVDGELAKSLQVYKKQIQYPSIETITDLSISKYQNELEASLLKGLMAFGYFVPSFEYSSNEIDEWKSKNVYLTVTKGAQVHISDFVIDTDLGLEFRDGFSSQPSMHSSVPEKLIQQVLKAKSDLLNKPLISSVYESHKVTLQSIAVSHGYFDFKWQAHDVRVASQQASASILWDIKFGQRYQFGKLEFISEDRGAELVEAVKQFQTGDWFTQSELAKFTQRVRQTGYFDSVIVRPNKENKTLVNQQAQVPIELILKSKPKDSFRFGLGFATDTGARATTNWQRPWVNLRGHSVNSSIYLSRQEQTIDLGYTVPMANPLNDFFKFQFGAKRISENQTDSQIYTLALQRQVGAKNEDDWNKVFSIKYSREEFVQGFADQQKSELLVPGFSLNRVRKNDDIFVVNGDRQIAALEGASDALISDINVAKLTFSTKWIRTFGKHRWVARADAGVLVTNDFESVPSSMRFFAGGDQSIRGFGLDELAQSRINENGKIELIGGQYLNVASIEYAYSVSDNWRGAVFIDAGGAGAEFADEIAKGIGAGVHWLSPVGTIRLYLARGISETEKNWRIHFSIGPGL